MNKKSEGYILIIREGLNWLMILITWLISMNTAVRSFIPLFNHFSLNLVLFIQSLPQIACLVFNERTHTFIFIVFPCMNIFSVTLSVVQIIISSANHISFLSGSILKPFSFTNSSSRKDSSVSVLISLLSSSFIPSDSQEKKRFKVLSFDSSLMSEAHCFLIPP